VRASIGSGGALYGIRSRGGDAEVPRRRLPDDAMTASGMPWPPLRARPAEPARKSSMPDSATTSTDHECARIEPQLLEPNSALASDGARLARAEAGGSFGR
jgi:hypothetical protein